MNALGDRKEAIEAELRRVPKVPLATFGAFVGPVHWNGVRSVASAGRANDPTSSDRVEARLSEWLRSRLPLRQAAT